MALQEKRENPFSERLFGYRSVEKKKLALSLAITLAVMVVEFIGGLIANSIALISDAGHMFTHSFAIGLSLTAILIAKKPPCHHRTFGLYRAEVLAAFVNGLFLLLVVGVIAYEAVMRIANPRDVVALHMLSIALLGLTVNLVSIYILRGSHEGLNVRSVFYHMMADAASSIGIVAAAIAIFYTGCSIIDPIVSLCISGVILYWAQGVMRSSTRILLEMAPSGLDTEMIAKDLMGRFPELREIRNVHLWTITEDLMVFSAHVSLGDGREVIPEINRYLADRYGIVESTIQVTEEEEVCG
jgi:cobalt-zinc-cadmium efflux system protein